MKLADLATGSDWIVWILFAIFAVLSIILLSGHGSWFISGYLKNWENVILNKKEMHSS